MPIDPNCICQGTGLVTRLTNTGNTGAELCDCVIPVSALLSDEVVERFAAKLYEDYCEIPAPPNGDFADESDGARERWMGLARDYLTAVIEQVGGGQGAE